MKKRHFAAMVVAGLLSVSCSSSPEGESASPPTSSTGASTSSSTSSSTSPSAAPTPEADPACLPGAGRVVTELPDVTVPAVDVPPVTDPDTGDVLVDGFTVPAQVVDAGCVVRYDAPGGCLGAVTITAATIPAATIPASTVAATQVGDEDVPEHTLAAVVAASATRGEVHAPQVCQVRTQGRVVGVSRLGVVREGFSRDGVARPGGVRPRACDGDDCVPEVRVDAVRLPPVQLPDVDVDPARLASAKLAGRDDVDVIGGGRRTSYVAPATTLFDSDSAVLRSDARSALEAIAGRIRATAPGRRLLVEGHTDDRGSAAHGLVLSRQRAAAVADWLVGHGFARKDLRTKGYGEADPVVPNTSDANRQRNRRVVITVLGS